MVADAPPVSAFRPDAPTPLQEAIAVALRREESERYENIAEFAQALRWSRERSPEVPAGERGGWVLDQRPPLPPTQAPDLVPVDIAVETPANDPQMQTTVLRVAPIAPPTDEASAI
jgi:hypothetical protein